MNYFSRKPIKIISCKTNFRGKPKVVKVYQFLKSKHQESSSFGFQWNRYQKVQIDRLNGTTISRDHLKELLGKPLSSLKGKTVLEIGSGAGRYTDILCDYAKQVITVDPSDAIFANYALGAPNVIGVQADLFDIPVLREKIDIVYCRGVIQHTRDPRLAIKTLFNYVRDGGIVIYDVYPKTWRNIFFTKYYLRPIVKRVNKKDFIKFTENYIPHLLWFKAKILNKMVPDIRYVRDIPDILLPIADHTRRLKKSGLTWDQSVEWSILDTFDAYMPTYDTPLSFDEIVKVSSQDNTKIIYASEDQFQFRVKRLKD